MCNQQTDSIWVRCQTTKEFLGTYYRPERYTGRGEAYAASLLASRDADYNEKGYDLISRHDSVRGVVVWRIGDAPLPDWLARLVPQPDAIIGGGS